MPKITSIETIRLDEFPNVLWVQIVSDDGLTGLGETFFGAATVEAYIHETAAQRILGEEAGQIDPIRRKLRPYVGYQAPGAEVRGNSAIDIALWDLWGKRTSQPVWQLLGGQSRDKIRTYNTCAGYKYVRGSRGQDSSNWGLSGDPGGPYEDLDAFFDDAGKLAESLLDQGITAMKIWPFDRYAEASEGFALTDAELKEGCEPFEKIRAAVGDRMAVMLECHSLWSLPVALKIARAMEKYDLMWIEDPIPASGLNSLADFRRQTPIPVTSSETLATRQQFRALMEAQAADIIMLDIGWVGGLSEAKAIAGMAEAWHLPVAPHDCTGPVVYAASVHLSINAPNALIQESVRSFYTGWHTEVATKGPAMKDGFIYPPEGAGLGVELLPGIRDRGDAHVVISK